MGGVVGGGVRGVEGGGGWGWGGVGEEPGRGAGGVADGPQDDERQTGDDKKPGEDANECFPGFLLSPVGSERALRFLLCHDLFPFDRRDEGIIKPNYSKFASFVKYTIFGGYCFKFD